MLVIQDKALFEIHSHPDSYREWIDKKLKYCFSMTCKGINIMFLNHFIVILYNDIDCNAFEIKSMR